MPITSAEAFTSSWYPQRSDLILRPRYPGLAIDPPLPHEVDDAIHIEPTNDQGTEFMAYIHIADGALLHDTDVVDGARHKGWSRYFDDGSADLMLPTGVTDLLNLNKCSKTGVPAVTISFEFSKTHSIGSVLVQRSLVNAKGLSYKEFHQKYKKHDPDARYTAKAAQLLANHTKLQSLSTERFAEDVVGRFMVIANFIIAEQMESAGVPWLFRNNTKEAYLLWGNPEERANFERMRVALYGAIALKHDSLGIKRYCHFTSPLRRFADLANHANLGAYLDGAQPPYSEADIRDIAHELTALYVKRSSQFSKQTA